MIWFLPNTRAGLMLGVITLVLSDALAAEIEVSPQFSERGFVSILCCNSRATAVENLYRLRCVPTMKNPSKTTIADFEKTITTNPVNGLGDFRAVHD